jgi:TRAP-type mannitol/chloroaromatic compound transport system permease small subunit
MSGLLSLSRAIDALNTFIGKSVSWLLPVAVLISAVNAVTRKLFNLSSNAWLEAQWYLFSAVFLIAAAYTLLSSEHVKVDLVYSHMPRKAQLWVEILGTLFFLFPFCLIAIYRERDEHPTFPFVIEAARTAPSSTGAERNGWRSR